MKRFMKILAWVFLFMIISIVIIGIIFFYQARFKGQVEEITLTSDIELEGIFIKPEGSGPFPVILMLHGAGDSHQPYDKLYFRFHANAFLNKGFAVLLYSKRSKQNVDYGLFTYEDLLGDAQVAIDYLSERKDVDKDNIGVMGVSESGWFTPELVYRNPRIKFLINRVSSPFSVQETLSHEIRSDALNEGYSREEIEETILPFHQSLWRFYIDVHQQIAESNGHRRDSINRVLKELNQDAHFGKWFGSAVLGKYDSAVYSSRAKRFSYDPMKFFETMKQPALYVMAGKDKNIPTDKVIDFLEVAKQDGKDITIKKYPDASHYLYKYGLEDGPYEGWMYYDDYLDFITDWAVRQVD